MATDLYRWNRGLTRLGEVRKNSTMAQFDCFEKPLSIFFYKYGKYISRHPLPFVLFPVLLTAALSLGFLRIGGNEVTDATYLFTPTNAPSKVEREVIHQKWPIHDKNYIPGRSVTQSRETQLILTARGENVNILYGEYAAAVKRINDFIRKRISIEYNGTKYTYEELCLGWKERGCHSNAQALLVSDLYNEGINISYPTFRLGSYRIYLGSSLGGVSLRREPRDDSLQLVGARSWLLLYQLKFQPANVSYVSGLWELELERQMLAYRDPYIELTFFHSQTLTNELKRNAEQLVPRFAVSFFVLVSFAVICSACFIKGSLFVDWVLSKPFLALSGCLTAGMAVISTIGILNYVGFPYNDIVLVMPFLAVAIGVDNMFLMLAAYRRTNRSSSLEKRVAESLSDAAISISITAITDALSFGVGAITTIPAVQLFCVYTCVAIVLTFLYQLTFFVGLLVLSGMLEEKHRHCVLFLRTDTPEEARVNGCVSQTFLTGSRPPPNPKSESENISNTMATTFFRDWYAPILMQPVVRAIVLLWFAIYLSFAVWGCTQIREGLEPVNLLVRDSYAIPHYRRLEEYFWQYGPEVQIVVNNAPDLKDPTQRQKIQSMVSAFANTEHTIGAEGVQFWLHEFLHYVEELSIPAAALNTDSFYKLVRHFFATNTYDRWSEDVHWGREDPERIAAFRFVVGLKDFAKTKSQQETTELLRKVAAGYAQYNVTTFMPVWLFTDQYRLIFPNTIQNVGIALSCMVVIALLLIPQPLCALWVAIAVASIDAGVIGYMTLWGVNLDAISMITIIMSIGFSVDFSAHITYGYVISDEERASGRVRMALGALGWPITQGALSTVLGVAILSTVDAYMIVTFFKTVFLVISIGALHGIVFLPVLLSIFVRGSCIATRKPSPKK